LTKCIVSRIFRLMPVALPVMACLCALALPAFAVHPGQWQHDTEADFADGQTEQTLVTNLGDVKLAAAVTQLAALDDQQARIINDLQLMPNGDLFLAAGPEGKLLLRRDGDVQTVLELTDEQIFCLDRLDDKLLVAVSGVTCRLAVWDGAQLTDLVTLDLPEPAAAPAAESPEAPESPEASPADAEEQAAEPIAEPVRYIWDMLVDGSTVYLATGAQGKLLAVDLSGDAPAVTELWKADQANLLCLGRDGQGRIYVGTDTDGLVYRVTIADGAAAQPYAVYDAAEPEIGALLVLADGTVYAGTADAEQARPGRLEEPVEDQTGRPEPDDEADDATAPADDVSQAPAEADAPAPVADPPADVEAASSPTAEQMDALRAEIRRRLLNARKTGVLPGGDGEAASRDKPGRAPARSQVGEGGAEDGEAEGNAIYQIDPEGFVTEVFRDAAMILKITQYTTGPHAGKLLVATGNEGELYQVDPDARETVILAQLDVQQIPAALMLEDADRPCVLLGTANPASLVEIDGRNAATGTFASKPLDAAQISLWGAMQLLAAIPAGSTVGVQTRSGNVDDAESGAWSDWSSPVNFEHDPNADPLAPLGLHVESPPARLLQYRLTLTGDGTQSPTIDRVTLHYIVPNLTPVIETLTAQYADEEERQSDEEAPVPLTTLKLEWQVSDPNEDALTYNLEYKSSGGRKWLPLADDLTETSFEWDTRRVPAGRYIVRLTASDSPDNPPGMARSATHLSQPVTVDNDPPVLSVLVVAVEAGQITLSVHVADGLSVVRALHYAVDSTDHWQLALPDDLIYDSTAERITVTIPDLSPGPHVVTLRATDRQNTAVYQAIELNVD